MVKVARTICAVDADVGAMVGWMVGDWVVGDAVGVDVDKGVCADVGRLVGNGIAGAGA